MGRLPMIFRATVAALLISCLPVFADPLPQYIMSGGNQIPKIVSVPCSSAYEDGSFERGVCYLHSLVTIGGETIVAFQQNQVDQIEVFATEQGTYQIIRDGSVIIERDVIVSFDECDPTMEYEWRLKIQVDSEYWQVFCLSNTW